MNILYSSNKNLSKTLVPEKIIKGVCHEIFDLHFFHDLNPSRPLINRLKYFRTRFRFHQDIQIFKKLRSVHPTVESSSVVCIPPLSQAPSCASHHGVKKSKFLKKLCGVQLCIPLRSQAPWCASHCEVKLLGVKIEIFVSLWLKRKRKKDLKKFCLIC